MRLIEVSTPALVLDQPRLTENCARMLAKCRHLGVALRPHMKTLKSAEAARLAVDPMHGGIAVATFNEAEYFAAAGFDDIQQAVCITPGKLPRAHEVLKRAPGFSFFVDSLEVVRAVVDYAAAHQAAFRVWIEIDCGEHRTGVDIESPELIDIARALEASPYVVLAGVATHAGHAYNGRSAAEIATIAEDERRLAVAASARLLAAGVTSPGVSIGSSPTAALGRSGEGVTEIRAGVYTVGDLAQAALGVLSEDQIALTVLATVISRNRERGQVVVDAGGLALSRDRSTATTPGPDRGYGLVLDLEGRASYGELILADVHQEHGEIRGVAPAVFDRLPIGTKVRIVPNHACMTAAMYDRYQVIDAGGEVIAAWGRTNGWL